MTMINMFMIIVIVMVVYVSAPLTTLHAWFRMVQLNIFLAILVDAYADVKEDAKGSGTCLASISMLQTLL
jgi:hypothetical protein